MKVLCWQFHRDAGRVRDGQNSIQWASCSTELTVRYCMQYQIEYMYSSTPEYWTIYPGAGPGFERFQVFQPQYDTYDFILYLDTDILLSSNAPNLFEQYQGFDIVSFNWPNKMDLKLFSDNGWLSTSGIKEDHYKDRYVAGGMYMMSRRFRKQLRKQVTQTLFKTENDIAVPLTFPEFYQKWPCGDQSILSYLMCKYNFLYAKLPREWTRGPYAYNFCGDKTDDALTEYFSLYHQYRSTFSSCAPIVSLEEATDIKLQDNDL